LRIRRFDHSPSVRCVYEKAQFIGEEPWLFKHLLLQKHELGLNERLRIYVS